MRKMLAVFFVLCLGVSVFASGKEWLTDIDEAMKQSKETGKPILADFTGSDWCKWCVRLDKEIFSQDEFKDFAKENLILLLVDFPFKKPISEEQKLHNKKLKEKYDIKGYPTVLLLDCEGKVLLKTGYLRGGVKKYVDFLKSKLPKKKPVEKKQPEEVKKTAIPKEKE